MAITWTPVVTVTERRRSLGRPLRFGVVGLAASLVQLAALTTLVELHVLHVVANLAALVLATQFNFLLSALMIWPDRAILRQPVRVILQRLVAFNASSGLTLLLNEAVFAATVSHLPYLAAAVCGIAVAAPLNFLIQHFLIFRVRKERTSVDAPRRLSLRRLPSP